MNQEQPASDTRPPSAVSTTATSARAQVALAIVAVIALALWVLGALSSIFLLVFASALLAVFLTTLRGWISRHTPLSETISLALVLLLLAGILGLGSWLLASTIAAQVEELAERLPKATARLGEYLERYTWGRELLANTPDWNLLRSRRVLEGATQVVSTTIGAATSFLVFLVLGIFFAFEPELYRRGLLRLFPLRRRARAAEVFDELGHVLGRWLLGKLVGMTAVGVALWVGLMLLGNPLALTLALLAGVMNFVPYIGPLLSMIPAVLLALLEGPSHAGYVVVLYLVVQNLEGYVLTPLIEKKTVSLPPALTLSGQLVMGLLFGGLGVVLATPFSAVLVTLTRRVYVQDLLGDESVDEPAPAPLPGIPEATSIREG
ncbi:AI-2E family transporter [Chondromyces crocatus]|uniref:Permease n=1 Tax=Chondromyces crocatus TaxID=52 RepID=A0A0K1E9Z4_CHOCO|nr:AI-2E family transporter [Chondromyces crocatus]AKT37664.1 uncharacterized protein CMC5_018060 [Chondromyces crocatus]